MLRKYNKMGLAAAACTLLGMGAANAAMTYDEAVNGDLPHSNAAVDQGFGIPNPNSVALSLSSSDTDAFLLTVPVGFLLTSFTLDSYIGPDKTFHIEPVPNPGGVALGTSGSYVKFGSANLSENFLDTLGIGSLGEGSYKFVWWHNNTAKASMSFDMNFSSITPIPEPASVLSTAGLLASGLMIRRRKVGSLRG